MSLSFSGRWQPAPAALLATFSAVFPLPHPPFPPRLSTAGDEALTHAGICFPASFKRDQGDTQRMEREERDVAAPTAKEGCVGGGGGQGKGREGKEGEQKGASFLLYSVQRTLAAVLRWAE